MAGANMEAENRDDTNPKLTFGKYRGRRVSELPASYLSWGAAILNEGWATTFKNELKRRGIA